MFTFAAQESWLLNNGWRPTQPTFLQQKIGDSAATPTPVTLNMVPTQGNILIAQVGLDSGTITSITQTGVVWSPIINYTTAGAYNVDVWIGVVGASPSASLSIAYSGGGMAAANVSEWAGVSTTLDGSVVTNFSASSVTSAPTGTLNTTNANDLIIATASNANPASAGPTNSFVALTKDEVRTPNLEPSYRIVSSTGSYSTSWTQAAAPFADVIFALKATVSADSTTSDLRITGDPANARLINDPFSRVVSNSWGRADVGGDWIIDTGTASFFSVDGSKAKATGVTNNVTQIARLASTTVTDFELNGRVALDAVPIGTSASWGILGRYDGGGTTGTYYGFLIRPQVDGSITAQIDRRLSGANTTLGSQANALTGYTANTWVRFRAQAIGSAVRMKIWYDGNAEPSTWNVDTTDTNIASGNVGVRLLLNPGMTNTPAFWLDDLTADPMSSDTVDFRITGGTVATARTSPIHLPSSSIRRPYRYARSRHKPVIFRSRVTPLQSNRTQDFRVTAQLSDSKAQDLRIVGQATDQRTQDIRVTAQQTDSKTQDLRIVGQISDQRTQDLRVTASASDSYTQNFRIVGDSIQPTKPIIHKASRNAYRAARARHKPLILRPASEHNFSQTHYRLRNDDGDEATATWMAALDTPANVLSDTVFRLRLAVLETHGGGPGDLSLAFQVRRNGGAWSFINPPNTPGGIVQRAQPNGFAGSQPTTQQITSGSFAAGTAGNINSTTVSPVQPLAVTEVELGLRINHNGGGAANGDVFDFRAVYNLAGGFQGLLDSYAVPFASVTLVIPTKPRMVVRSQTQRRPAQIRNLRRKPIISRSKSFPTLSNVTRDLRVTGQLTDLKTQDLRITGQNTDSKTQDFRIVGDSVKRSTVIVRTASSRRAYRKSRARRQPIILRSRAIRVQISKTQDLRIVGQSTDSQTQDLRIVASLGNTKTQDLRLVGQAVTSSDWGTLDDGTTLDGGPLDKYQPIYIGVTGQLTDSKTQDLRVTGQNTDSKTQDFRIIGQNAASTAQDFRVVGVGFRVRVPVVRTTTQRRAAIRRRQRRDPIILRSAVTPKQANKTQDLRIAGQASDQRTQDIRVTGQAFDSDIRNLRVTGQASDFRTQDLRITAQASDLRTQDLRVTGQSTDSKTQDLRLVSQDVSSRSQDFRLVATSTDSSTVPFRITAQLSDSTSVDLRVTSSLGDSYVQSFRITGTSLKARPNVIHMASRRPAMRARLRRKPIILRSQIKRTATFKTQDFRVQGQLSDTKTQDLRITGQLADAKTQDLRLVGQTTSFTTSDLRITGQTSSLVTLDLRIKGQAADVRVQDLRVAGQLTDSKAQDLRIVGQLPSFSTLALRVIGQLSNTYSKDFRLTGQAVTASDWGTLDDGTTLDGGPLDKYQPIYLAIRGQNTNAKTQDLRISGQAINSSLLDLRISGQLSSVTVLDLRIIGAAEGAANITLGFSILGMPRRPSVTHGRGHARSSINLGDVASKYREIKG